MKVHTMFAVAAVALVSTLVACSSSSSGGSSSVPTCQGGTGTTGAGSPACSSCVQSHCGSQISSAMGACSAYYSCYSGCQCSDVMCLTGCVSKIDSTCQNSYGPITMCLSQNCMSECSMTVNLDGGGD